MLTTKTFIRPSRWKIRWFAAISVLQACGSGPATIAPLGLAPTESRIVGDWVAPLAPRQARLYTVRPWRYRNERGAAAGRAAVRVAPPDSLRFDYQGPFRKSGRAAIVGDSALWVVPEEDFSGLVALAPLFWVAVGIPPHPPPGTEVHALEREDLRAWRFVHHGDTLSFVMRGSPVTRIQAEIRRAGRTIGLSEVRFDPETGMPVEAEIDLLFEPSRFEFAVESIDTTVTFDASIWQQH